LRIECRRSSVAAKVSVRPQKLPAWPETRQIGTSLESRDRNNKTSIDDEILRALAERLGRFVSLPGSQFTIRQLTRVRESVPAETARVLSGTQNQTSPNFRFSTGDPDIAQPLVQIDAGIDGGDAPNLHQLAAQALPNSSGVGSAERAALGFRPTSNV
jgi:hypothetical protein